MITRIRASAGSGKTYALTRRFLELLRQADPDPRSADRALFRQGADSAPFRPDAGYSLAEILAATFTNKAAAEMKTRVVRGLKEQALAERAQREGQADREAEPAGAGALLASVLRHYGSLNIRTIDSLLDALVRLSALELGLRPDFEISFDPEEYFTPFYDALMEDLARSGGSMDPPGERGADGAEDFPGGTDDPGSADSPGGGGLFPPSAPLFHITDAPGLKAALEDACRSQVLYAEARGFTVRGRLHKALHSLAERLLRGEEVPLADPAAIKERIHALHGGLRLTARDMLDRIESEGLAAAKPFLTFAERCSTLPSAYASPPESVYARKESLDECLNKASRGAAPESAHQAFARLRESHAEFSRALPLLKHALQLAPLALLAHELFLRMEAAGERALPAPRLPLLAGKALDGEDGVTDALCRLGSSLTHVLLDEFQDTSREQWAAIRPLILECLSRGGTFAYVGDVKQAIYGWRGGDARLFDEAARDGELTAVAPEPRLEHLPRNWRSRPAVVRHNNAFFSLLEDPQTARDVLAAMLPAHTPPRFLDEAVLRVTGAFAGARQDLPPDSGPVCRDASSGIGFARGQGPDSPAPPGKNPPSSSGGKLSPPPRRHDMAGDFPPAAEERASPEQPDQGRVCLYTVSGANNAQVEEVLFERLRRLFLEEFFPGGASGAGTNTQEKAEEDGNSAPASGSKKPWRFGDVAVLVRSGDEAALITRLLTGWGLPVVTENSFLLAGHPLISRLTALLSFLDYPPDDLAFWEFISGPECFGAASGLSAPRLHGWLAEALTRHGAAEGGARPAGRPPLYVLFRRDFPAEWQALIGPFHAQAGLMSAYDTLVEIIRRYGLEDRLPEQAPFIRRFLEAAHLAESRGLSSPAAFLAWWKESGGDETVPLPEGMDAVRVMTMHKAKGLEFPVVVAPFHHRGRRRDNEPAVAEVAGLRVLTRSLPELEDAHYPACLTDELERLNLLYVAWTRPTDELHAFITRPDSVRRMSPLMRGLEVLLERFEALPEAALCQWERLEYGSGPDEADAFAEETDPPPEETGTTSAREAPLSFAAVRPAVFEVPRPLSRTAVPALPGLLPLPWRPMEWLPELKIYRSVLEEASFTPERRGTLAHLCLEHLFFSGPKDAEGYGKDATAAGAEGAAADVRRAVRLGMRLFPLPLERPEEAEAAMNRCLTWFARQPGARAWLETGRREQTIIDESGTAHRVDLLADEGDAGLVAVDYKTGRPRPEHHEQVRRYMRLLQEARRRPVRGVLVYLDDERMEEVLP